MEHDSTEIFGKFPMNPNHEYDKSPIVKLTDYEKRKFIKYFNSMNDNAIIKNSELHCREIIEHNDSYLCLFHEYGDFIKINKESFDKCLEERETIKR